MISDRSTAAAQIAEWLRLFLAPGQITELRCLTADHKGDKVSGFFDFDHIDKMAHEAAWYDDGKQFAGIYFVPNPLSPELLSRRPNRATITRKDHSKDSDVVARRWLYLDADAERARGHKEDSANESERDAALQVITSAIGLLAELGWPSPLIVDSGNGFHAYYPLASDDAGDKVPALLKAIAAACNTKHAKIDTAVSNPARLMKLPGTTARKGTPTSERPHRLCRVVSVPNGWPNHGSNQLDNRTDS